MRVRCSTQDPPPDVICRPLYIASLSSCKFVFQTSNLFVHVKPVGRLQYMVIKLTGDKSAGHVALLIMRHYLSV